MSRRGVRLAAMGGVALAVVLFVTTVTLLRWIAVVLVLVSIPVLMWTLFNAERRDA